MATVATPIRLGPADHGRRMTLEEFMEAEVEEGDRYELGRGVLEVTEVPNDPHGQVVTNLYDAVGHYRRTHPGIVLRYGGGAEFQLWFPGAISGRNPDLGVVLYGAPKDARGRRRPALVAEVVSRGSVQRDYEIKREEYRLCGLLEYWIVDPMQRHVVVLIRDGDVWIEHVFRDDQIIASLVLPGFETRVAELWIDIEVPEPFDEDLGPDGDL
jgi:Uma2 family endonuclease